ncbi:leucine zipper domain-containing protein [Streptomyces sp. NPDC050508]|uniref:leucine zipper domain-containing protein n=1 Tax=Streptomyces sp. NPDC050508 TaxID=3155405 RepID=UPI0034288406
MRQARTTGVAPAVVRLREDDGKWVNRRRLHGDAGLQDRPSSPYRSPNATPAWVIEQTESWRRQHKWSAQRVTDELVRIGL